MCVIFLKTHTSRCSLKRLECEKRVVINFLPVPCWIYFWQIKNDEEGLNEQECNEENSIPPSSLVCTLELEVCLSLHALPLQF